MKNKAIRTLLAIGALCSVAAISSCAADAERVDASSEVIGADSITPISLELDGGTIADSARSVVSPKGSAFRFGRAVFLLTPVSFLLAAGFLVWFFTNLPAGYQWEPGRGGVSSWDIAFALLLLANHVLVFLSFLCFLDCVFEMLRRQKILWPQVGRAALGLYPILVAMTLCAWDMAKLTLYFCWPVRVLFLH